MRTSITPNTDTFYAVFLMTAVKEYTDEYTNTVELADGVSIYFAFQ